MLDKGSLISAIEGAFRNASPGQDSVSSLASAIGNAIETYVKSGTVEVNSTTGACNYAGAHPPLKSVGVIK
jgi:hypothetical protein